MYRYLKISDKFDSEEKQLLFHRGVHRQLYRPGNRFKVRLNLGHLDMFHSSQAGPEILYPICFVTLLRVYPMWCFPSFLLWQRHICLGSFCRCGKFLLISSAPRLPNETYAMDEPMFISSAVPKHSNNCHISPLFICEGVFYDRFGHTRMTEFNFYIL